MGLKSHWPWPRKHDEPVFWVKFQNLSLPYSSFCSSSVIGYFEVKHKSNHAEMQLVEPHVTNKNKFQMFTVSKTYQKFENSISYWQILWRSRDDIDQDWESKKLKGRHKSGRGGRRKLAGSRGEGEHIAQKYEIVNDLWFICSRFKT